MPRRAGTTNPDPQWGDTPLLATLNRKDNP